jgi:polyisoprenoid-binding protein YceI
MKKKLIIAAIVLVVLAIIGYVGFQWYLSTHKAESEVQKTETKEVENKDQTASGKTINSMAALDGIYVSEVTSPKSSEILFNIGGATATQGTFKEFSIQLEVSGDAKKITVEINPSSIYTAESMRDDHLRGEEFFHVGKFPKITFTSNEIITGDTSYLAKGNIEFMGMSNEITVPFSYVGPSSEDDQVEIFEGKFDFDRVKYGMEEASGAENDVVVSFYTALRKK